MSQAVISVISISGAGKDDIITPDRCYLASSEDVKERKRPYKEYLSQKRPYEMIADEELNIRNLQKMRFRNMDISRNSKKLWAGFFLVSVVFIFLRLKTLNHLLMWDEAWNILSLRAFLSNAKADPFYWGYFFHPPLYMTFAKFLAPFQAGFDVRLEALSLLCSYAALSAAYLLGAMIGGRRYAFLSGLLLSLMPASIGYDTWIKRDGLASALCYFSVLLLLRRRFLWCAITLSFALLSKESAAFFVLAVALILLMLNEKGVMKKILLMGTIIFVMTSWWYLCFSSFTNTVFETFFKPSKLWAGHPSYYFRKLLPDMGMAAIFFFIIGICYFSYLIFRKRQLKWSIPLIIVLAVYVPSSLFISTKVPWICLSARPALAMIAGGGALLLIKLAKRSKLLLAVLLIASLSAVYTGFSFSYSRYHMATYPNGWPGAASSRELACYLNERMQDSDRLMITEFAYWAMPVCAVFFYYWKGCPVEIIKGEQKAENVIKEIIMNKIAWLVIVAPHNPALNLPPLAEEMKKALGKPDTVGWSYVWDTRALWSND